MEITLSEAVIQPHTMSHLDNDNYLCNDCGLFHRDIIYPNITYLWGGKPHKLGYFRVLNCKISIAARNMLKKEFNYKIEVLDDDGKRFCVSEV